MNCDNTLWIDAVGLYYIAPNLNIEKLIKTILKRYIRRRTLAPYKVYLVCQKGRL
jgi:hypothetical protein